jgi:hypothetical protein
MAAPFSNAQVNAHLLDAFARDAEGAPRVVARGRTAAAAARATDARAADALVIDAPVQLELPTYTVVSKVVVAEFADSAPEIASQNLPPDRMKEKEKEEPAPRGGGSPREVNPRWKTVESTFARYLFEPDVGALEALCSAVAAHQLVGQAAWLMLIAPPGSAKTEFLKSLSGLERIWSVDAVTPRTFLSGQIGGKKGTIEKDASLLLRIGDSGIICIPDFSTVTGKRHEDAQQIYADLRRIFDGELSKSYGVKDGTVSWSGRITTLVAATPAIDRFTSVETALGDRFLRVRMERADVRAARMAQRQDPDLMRTALRDAMVRLFDAAADMPKQVEMDEAMIDAITALAELVAIARHPVVYAPGTREIISGGANEAESATRLAQQLNALARGHAAIMGRSVVTADDLPIVQRVALDTMPPRHRDVLMARLHHTRAPITSATTSYDVRALVHLGLLDSDGAALSEWAMNFAEQGGLISTRRGQRAEAV